MRFKKLELLGFKSFAEHTEFVFEPGVTAIVGPNGTGKSNVADGIKWVLGEQSARELRGGRMEDLIFNGSETRDPLHFAEVSITIDNSEKRLPIDYSEVSIARRLFRSGESEYLLNRTPVRLKDIQELLMGTGIGTAAYSLFEQGRIEQIISARPEERRSVFEEAAGITRFKSQKREALRKLEETEGNLARISDVIAEVKRQIQSLQRQVRRAKAYQEQMEELKRLETALARRQREELHRQWEEKEQSLQSSRGQVGELESRSGAQEELLQKARQAVAQADDALSKAREAWLSARAQQQTLHSGLQMNRERMAEGQTRQAQIRRAIEETEARAAQLQEQWRGLKDLIGRQEEEQEGMARRIARCQDRLESCDKVIEEAQGAIARTREQILEATGVQVQAKNHAAQIRQEAARLEARASRLQSERQKVTAERQEASRQAESFREMLLQSRTLLEGLEAEKRLCRENLEATEGTLAEAQRQAHGLEQEVTRCASQLEVLRELLVSHEGYSSGVKALLTALDQGQVGREGVIGVLAELMQVGREEMAAVDAALGPWAEAVVVESASVADRCRQFLEKSKAGRVLFLLRDRVPAHLEPSPLPFSSPPEGGRTGEGRLSPSPLEGEGWGEGAVRLLDRVGITPHLAPLLRLLLQDAWLVPDCATAQTLLQSTIHNPPSTIRFVTPDGEMFTAAAALLGSTPAEEGMVVGRMSRLQSLEITLGTLEGKLEESLGRLGALQSQRETQAQAITAVEANCLERIHEIQRVEANLSSAQSNLEKLDQEMALLKTEHSEASGELEGVQSQLKQAEEELAAKEQQTAALEAALHRAHEMVTETVRSREQASVDWATAKAESASFEQIANSRQASLTVLEQSIQAAQDQISAHAQELLQWEGRQAGWEGSCAELERSGAALDAQQAQLRISVDQAEGKRFQTLEAARVQEEEFVALRRRLEQLQGRLHAREMEQAQLAFQREQIGARLQQVYQIDLENQEPPPSPHPTLGGWGKGPQTPSGGEEKGEGEDPEALAARIQELSEKMQRMGPVNLGSIEEEQELGTRYEYLTTQQNDLLKAKDDLHEALTKINRTTRAMFRETFQAIQKEFQVAFKQLFGGGEARLVLMDEEDVLESGIEIIARPPGKPLQPISLLSGGEKALTTIALLFAIFRVKPSPFCLLDEIDAPLDESNIDRFTAALKGFLKDSQFIIITHNKRTISMADVMYGVTMQEMGVSKIVSVKFKNGNGSGAPGGVSGAASDSGSHAPLADPTQPTPQRTG